jgi:hypothetical protein
MNRSNIDGITGKSFTLGTGSDACTLSSQKNTLTINQALKLEGDLDLGEHKLTSSATAKEDSDLVNLSSLTAAIDKEDESLKKFVNDTVADVTAGTANANVMLSPVNLDIEDMADGWSVELGTLASTKFIDRVVFEVFVPFTKANGDNFEISVGTITEPEKLVPKFPMERLSSTYVVDICKTLFKDTAYYLYVTKKEPDPEPEPEEPEPTPFEQQLYCTQYGVTTDISSDASQKVWTFTLSGDDLLGHIGDTDTFGNVTGPLMDFSFNIPVEVGHQYRVVQQNPALAYFDSDPFIVNVSGTWSKDKSYQLAEDEGTFIYSFTLTQSSGSNDYVHIYVYDLDGETPDNAIRTYHIKNELNFEGTSPEDSPLQIDFASASEGTAGVVQNAENQYTITLSGEIHSLDLENISGHSTELGIYYPKAVGSKGIRLAIYNPAASNFTDEEAVTSKDGIYYTDMTATDEDEIEGMWIDIPISEDNSYPIVAAIIDLETQDYFLVGIDNQLTFLDSEEEPEEEAETTVMKARAYNLASVDEDDSEESEVTTDQGSAFVRILSF